MLNEKRVYNLEERMTTMKEIYVSAEMEIIKFEQDDIITSSNETTIVPFSLSDEIDNSIK